MNVTIGDLEMEVHESTAENEDHFGGRHGWFWHASIMPPKGPFGSAVEAVRDFADWMERRTEPREPTADAVLANTLIKNATAFLDAAEAGGGDGTISETVLMSSCNALDLIVKAYLISRGRRPHDPSCSEGLSQELVVTHAQAVRLGLPNDDARIARFLKAAASAFARNELAELAANAPPGLAAMGFVMAIRSLRRDVERALEP